MLSDVSSHTALPEHTGSAPEPPRRPHVEVRRVGPDLASALANFFRAVWDDDATSDKILAARAAEAASNPVEPGGDVPAFVFLSDGKVLGYLGTIPVSFWNGRTETPTYWLKGFMVLPEYRNGPVGFNVLKEALKVVGPSGAIAAAPPARRLLTALGFVECGQIPNAIALLRPARVLASLDVEALGLPLPRVVTQIVRVVQRTGLATLGGGVAGLGLSAWRALGGTGRRSLRVEAGGTLPAASELDTLWRNARDGMAAAAVRDGTFLPWRYRAAPGAMYEAVTVRDRDGTVAAVATVRRPKPGGDDRLRGIMVATLSDVLFPANRPDAGLAALAGAERVARRMGADALLCSATHPAVTSLLSRRAYIRAPGNVYFLARDPGGALALPKSLNAWWVTRGDAWSDDAF